MAIWPDDWDWGIERVMLLDITPDLARFFLARNTKNRKLRAQKVRTLRISIEQGGYFLVPDGVGFDWDGVLTNAQHRLTVVEKTGVTRRFVVVFGLDPESWAKTDRNSIRTFADALHTMHGEANAKGLQAALRLLYKYETTGDMTYNSGSAYVDDEDMLMLLDRYPGIRDAVRFGKNQASSVGLGALKGTFIAVVYHCFSVAHPDDTEEFFSELVHPTAGGQIEVLYDRLARHVAAKARGVQGGPEILDERQMRAFVIITFNKWITGEPLKQLSWKPGGARAQPFPLVHGYPFPDEG